MAFSVRVGIYSVNQSTQWNWFLAGIRMLVEMGIVYLCELKLLFRRAKSTGGMRSGVVDDGRRSKRDERRSRRFGEEEVCCD